MTKNTRFSPDVRQRPVRRVIEGQNDYDSQWADIRSILCRLAVRRRPCVSGCVSTGVMQGAELWTHHI